MGVGWLYYFLFLLTQIVPKLRADEASMITQPMILRLPTDQERLTQLRRELAICDALIPDDKPNSPGGLTWEEIENAVTHLLLSCLLSAEGGEVATQTVYNALSQTYPDITALLDQHPIVFNGICADIDRFCQGHNLI